MKKTSKTIKRILQAHKVFWAISVLVCFANVMQSNPFPLEVIANLVQLLDFNLLDSLKGGGPTDVINFVNF